MAFSLHPILETSQTPKAGVWYAIAPDDIAGSPSARVGACASFISEDEGRGGRVVITAGVTGNPASPRISHPRVKFPSKFSTPSGILAPPQNCRDSDIPE